MLSFITKIFLSAAAALGIGKALKSRVGAGKSLAKSPAPEAASPAGSGEGIRVDSARSSDASAAVPAAKPLEGTTPATEAGEADDAVSHRAAFAGFGGSAVTPDIESAPPQATSASADDAAAANRAKRSKWHASDASGNPAGSIAASAEKRPAGTAFGGAEAPGTNRAEPVPLAAPDPRGRTPHGENLERAPKDDLVEKYRAEAADRDWKAVDYSNLSEDHSHHPDHGVADLPPGPKRGDTPAEGEDAASLAAFRGTGVSGAVGVPLPDADGESRRSDLADEPSGQTGDEGEGAPAAVEPGSPRLLKEPDGGNPDDLTRITGIGPALERRLFENGIFHLRQIADWTEEEAEWVDRTIGFRGRVKREDWVGQAKQLLN